jgi:hypothetical protein
MAVEALTNAAITRWGMKMTREQAWMAVYDALAYEAKASETPTTPGLILVNQRRLIDCILRLANGSVAKG